MAVGSRSAEDCHQKYTEEQAKASRRPATKKTTSGGPEQKDKTEPVAITAKVGTFKRKQQMREFLDNLPKDDHDDVFTATPFQNRRVRVRKSGRTVYPYAFLTANSAERCVCWLQLHPTAALSRAHRDADFDLLADACRNDCDRHVFRMQKTKGCRSSWDKVKKQQAGTEHSTPASSRTRHTTDRKVQQVPAVEQLFVAEAADSSDEEEEEDSYFSV
ncbi:hypothetical protein ASZ78_014379 [Callipepla squamata]|uniref:Uncharacterized protein n=1 Tax=Callipepla squamata TaxID=9009 RepID=A0A226MNC3_CALSU|nr:hypothetical protein ASZ78_014379 [Callipepla squamata]